MEYVKIKDTYIVRLQKGEEILEQLSNLATKEKIECATVNGIGATDNATFGVLRTKNKEYVKKCITEDSEIVALNGNITWNDGKPYLHLHVQFATENACFGGHLNSAVISATAEIFVRKIDVAIGRNFDSGTGLSLMKF